MRRLVVSSVFFVGICLLASFGLDVQAADPPIPDSPGAKITREKKLKAKVTLDCENMMLRDMIPEIQGALKDAKAGSIRIKWDPKAVTATTRLTIKCKNIPLEDALDEMLTKSGRPWGYYVMVTVKKDDQDDGAIYILAEAACRGYPAGDPRNPKPKDAEESKKDDKKKDKK